ncbi:MAG: peptidoglycan editing factor PgeF [Endomicrobium sp.]|jgi:YfiH family protein|nr:peptidoglycan editing factor PgeF [Endomicrobium sp.]
MKIMEEFIFHQNFNYKHFTSTILSGNLKDKITRDNFLISQGLRPSDLVLANQVHSANIKIVGNIDSGNFIDNCDGLITNDKSIMLGVFTADCMPLLITNGTIKAAIHAGWKGIYLGIVENTIEVFKNKFSVHVKDIEVYIGPHIRSCCYEVGKNFEDLFNLKLQDNKLDLSRIVFNKLKNLGVVNIFDVNKCTFCQGSYFFSYRQNKTSERMLSLIV